MRNLSLMSGNELKAFYEHVVETLEETRREYALSFGRINYLTTVKEWIESEADRRGIVL
jgi:hypothetical protein